MDNCDPDTRIVPQPPPWCQALYEARDILRDDICSITGCPTEGCKDKTGAEIPCPPRAEYITTGGGATALKALINLDRARLQKAVDGSNNRQP